MGLIENRPNSRNVVPGEVFFTVDLRHPDETVLDKMEAAFRLRWRQIAEADKLELRGETHLEIAGGEVQSGTH